MTEGMLIQQATTPDIMTQQYRDMQFDDLESISSTGSKRGREEQEEDASWTESDLTAMQNVSRLLDFSKQDLTR